MLIYLNRLSDFLFVAARSRQPPQAGVEEPRWASPRGLPGSCSARERGYAGGADGLAASVSAASRSSSTVSSQPMQASVIETP